MPLNAGWQSIGARWNVAEPERPARFNASRLMPFGVRPHECHVCNYTLCSGNNACYTASSRLQSGFGRPRLMRAPVHEIGCELTGATTWTPPQWTLRSMSAQYGSRSLNFCNLPVAVRANESRNSTTFGHL